jgi:RNase P/RNase MRP subunit p29
MAKLPITVQVSGSVLDVTRETLRITFYDKPCEIQKTHHNFTLAPEVEPRRTKIRQAPVS